LVKNYIDDRHNVMPTTQSFTDREVRAGEWTYVGTTYISSFPGPRLSSSLPEELAVNGASASVALLDCLTRSQRIATTRSFG
jgi:hypothetical protein